MSTLRTMPSDMHVASAWRAWLVILGYGLLLTLPAGWSGFIATTDSLNHLIMSRHFADQLWAGDLYPRWLYEMNAGLGSPIFQFYAPVSFYITALFRPLLSHDPEGWRQLGLAASLAVIASGLTAYAWLARLAGTRAALIGAVLYMGAPYHLAVDLYQRFFFAELWGFVWMPLVMLSVRASIRGGMGAFVGLSVSYALLIMTHLPTTLLFSWVPVAYVLWIAAPGNRVGTFLRVVGGMLLGIGLSAIYLLPAMATQQYVLFGQMKSGFYYFANQFLFYGPRLDDANLNDYLNYLGIIASLMLVVSVAVWHLGRATQTAETRRESSFWALVAGLAFFMQLYPSKPLWDWVNVLQEVQFPGRFNTLLTLAMVVPVASWVQAKTSSAKREPAMWAIVALLVLLHTVPALKRYPQYGAWSATPALDGLISGVDEMRSSVEGDALAKNEQDSALLMAAKISRYNFFLPRWSNSDLFAETRESVQAMERLASRRDRAYLIAGEGGVRVERWLPHIELVVKGETAMQVGLLQFYYPGWVARIGGSADRLEVGPSRPDGLLAVNVPPGTHRILIEREPLPEERAGQLISSASLALLVALAAGRRRSPGDRP